MSDLTVTILDTEYNAFDLLRLRINQLDAITTLCADSLSDLDASYHDYIFSGLRDMVFEIRQLTELINDSKGG